MTLMSLLGLLCANMNKDLVANRSLAIRINMAILDIYRYDNELRTEYQIQCEPSELAYFNMIHLNIQGPEDCQDEEGHNR